MRLSLLRSICPLATALLLVGCGNPTPPPEEQTAVPATREELFTTSVPVEPAEEDGARTATANRPGSKTNSKAGHFFSDADWTAASQPVLMAPPGQSDVTAKVPFLPPGEWRSDTELSGDPRQLPAVPEARPVSDVRTVPAPRGAESDFARLLTAHRRGNPAMWDSAYHSLIADPATSAPVVIARLDHQDREVRQLASMLLPVLGDLPPDAETTLVERLKTASPLVRVNIAATLSRTGRHADAVVTALIELLPELDRELRRQAVLTLGHYGPHAAAAKLPLIRALGRSLPSDQETILGVLPELGPLTEDERAALEQLQTRTPLGTRERIDLLLR